MSHRLTYALGSTLVLVLIAGVGVFSLNSRSPAHKNKSTMTKATPEHSTLPSVGIYSEKPVVASQGRAVDSETLGSLGANNGFTLVYACLAPGSLHISISKTMSVAMPCNGQAVKDIWWSNVSSVQSVRVSASSSLWRVAIYLTKNPTQLPNYEVTKI